VEQRNKDELLVVLDTNILVSYFWGGETIGHIFEALFEGRFCPVVSDFTLAELNNVGKRNKFKEKFSSEIFQELFDTYQDVALHVKPKRKLFASSDIKDNIFLECAIECQENFLVTGDPHLLILGCFESVQIVKPAVFVEKALNW